MKHYMFMSLIAIAIGLLVIVEGDHRYHADTADQPIGNYFAITEIHDWKSEPLTTALASSGAWMEGTEYGPLPQPTRRQRITAWIQVTAHHIRHRY
jgi:hypothetical protein